MNETNKYLLDLANMSSKMKIVTSQQQQYIKTNVHVYCRIKYKYSFCSSTSTRK